MTDHVRLSANGRICIPADVRQQLGLKDGDTLSLTVTDNALVLRTARQRVRAAQAAVRDLMAGKPSFTVDEFLRERNSLWEPDRDPGAADGD